MAFWKPGSNAPGLGLERPDDFAEGEASSLLGFNPRHSLPIQQQRTLLPIYKVKSSLLYAMEKYQTIVLVGETGSGKSTQIPQYLHEAGWTQGRRTVVCTQPRRMAASTLAARVATEMGTELGKDVGYAVRFDQKVDVAGIHTSVKFVTDGLLLRETLYDPLLSSYSVIMLDEAHERSIYTDVLAGLLKKISRRRPELRIIISSATADAQAFRDFFESNVSRDASKDTATIISVLGRQYEVDVLYLTKPALNYINTAVDTVLSIIKSEGPGDVLVFLPGMEEIDKAVRKTQEYVSDLRDSNAIMVVPLYSQLPHHLQIKAIIPSPRHTKRKIIFATNIAETSLTIEGIRFVVDAGFVKLPIYDVSTGFESLVVSPVSRAAAIQRAGRAGRTSPGKCFRLYTEKAFLEEMQDHTIPEIQRSNLAWMILQLKALGIDEVMNFDFLSQPSSEAMIRGLELLYALGALDDKCKLTDPLGEKMAEFPVEPRLSKILLSSFDFGCTEEIMTVVALLQVQNIWAHAKAKESKERQEEAMSEFAVLEGDHLTLLNIYNAFVESNKTPEWCQEQLLNYRSLIRATEIRNQLRRYLERYKPPGSVFASCCEDTEALRRCIVAGFFFNAARLKADGRYYTVRGDHLVSLHPTSVLSKYGAPPEWVVYHDVITTTEEYIRDCLKIRPQWLMELAPHFYDFKRRGSGGESSKRRGRSLLEDDGGGGGSTTGFKRR